MQQGECCVAAGFCLVASLTDIGGATELCLCSPQTTLWLCLIYSPFTDCKLWLRHKEWCSQHHCTAHWPVGTSKITLIGPQFLNITLFYAFQTSDWDQSIDLDTLFLPPSGHYKEHSFMALHIFYTDHFSWNGSGIWFLLVPASLEVLQAHPTGKKPQHRPRTWWRDCISSLAQECLKIPPGGTGKCSREGCHREGYPA